MSNQICYAIFSIWATLSTRSKTEKSCEGGENHNITKGTSVYSGSPYMMSRDQLYHVMTSSDFHGVKLILSWTYASKRHTIIYSFMINRFFGIWLVSELFDPPTYILSLYLMDTLLRNLYVNKISLFSREEIISEKYFEAQKRKSPSLWMDHITPLLK